ncbi:unnamed protein product [Gordionus sp. m RMFG-2023]|uniref:uncharacterized protein LOC135923124 isoform X2 n=1 Tax=Gordionus sp. m RMFG-2023 TaxID=3053472 RepID=UPI0030DF546C
MKEAISPLEIFLNKGAIRGKIPLGVGKEYVFPIRLDDNHWSDNITIGMQTYEYGQLQFHVLKVNSSFNEGIESRQAKSLENIRLSLYEGNVSVLENNVRNNYPVSLIFKNGRLDTIFSIGEFHFEVYPIWNETATANYTKLVTYPHRFIKYKLVNSSEIKGVDMSTTFQKDDQGKSSSKLLGEDNIDILHKSYVIEGALFIDEHDSNNITEEMIILIGEKLSKIFEVLLFRINIRFKLVAWFPYPKDLVIDENMVQNQRNLEKYISTHPLRHTYDVGMLISSRAIESINKGYVVGWANVGTMCRRNQSALVAWYKPTSVAYFLSHELAHLLNSYHDSEQECDKGSQLEDQPYIDSKNVIHWSNCTIKVISDWIKAGKLDCLLFKNHTKQLPAKDLYL